MPKEPFLRSRHAIFGGFHTVTASERTPSVYPVCL